VDKPYRVGVAGVLRLGAFNLFFHLHDSQIMLWDESLHGILAQEMLESGRFIVTTYYGEPNDFFRKPPLGLWLIATSYRALGYPPSPCACPPLSARSPVSGCSWRSRGLPVQFRSENRLMLSTLSQSPAGPVPFCSVRPVTGLSLLPPWWPT